MQEPPRSIRNPKGFLIAQGGSASHPPPWVQPPWAPMGTPQAPWVHPWHPLAPVDTLHGEHRRNPIVSPRPLSGLEAAQRATRLEFVQKKGARDNIPVRARESCRRDKSLLSAR